MKEYIYMFLYVVLFIALVSVNGLIYRLTVAILFVVVGWLWKKERIKISNKSN